jgi:hypothetical protein
MAACLEVGWWSCGNQGQRAIVMHRNARIFSPKGLTETIHPSISSRVIGD